MAVDKMKGLFAGMDRVRLVLVLLTMAGTAIGAVWMTLAEPRIECKIDQRVQPIEDAMALQVFLTMETMDSAKVAAATAKYKQYKMYAKGALP